MIFNTLTSAGMSLLMFFLLFDMASDYPPDYPWYSPNCVGVVVASTIFVCPVLVTALAPAGMPEAVDKGWLYIVRPSDCSPLLLRVLPYLDVHPCFRIGCVRHLS